MFDTRDEKKAIQISGLPRAVVVSLNKRDGRGKKGVDLKVIFGLGQTEITPLEYLSTPFKMEH